MEKELFLKKLDEISDIATEIRNRAAKIHEDVNQTYGEGHPYSYHLDSVAQFTTKFMPELIEDEKDIIAVLFGAYFHDSIEDARLTYNDVMKIAREYMDDKQAYLATEIVYALTNEKGRNRHERANEKYYAGIRETKYAPLVKAADRLANCKYSSSPEGKKSMEKAYREEMPNFIHDVLTKEDGTYFVPLEMFKEFDMDIIGIQIKNIHGNVIFEHLKENNTIKKTVEEAALRGCDLKYADLHGADLSGANINCINLSYANLSNADLSNAHIHGANLTKANLSGANLSDANLSFADLIYANLINANLSNAVLYNAKFQFSNLKDTIINNTIFRNASLNHALNIPDNIPMACPEKGSFIAWKKLRSRFCCKQYLVKLEIPADARRFSATSKKCRCDKAKVLEIINVETDENVKEVINYNYAKCVYRVGEMVYPDSFDEDRWNECSNGIHFFIDKKDAINY